MKHTFQPDSQQQAAQWQQQPQPWHPGEQPNQHNQWHQHLQWQQQRYPNAAHGDRADTGYWSTPAANQAEQRSHQLVVPPPSRHNHRLVVPPLSQHNPNSTWNAQSVNELRVPVDQQGLYGMGFKF